MSYLLVIKEEAHQDTVVAYQYYEQQQPGLGERFLEALNAAYQSITQHPANYGYITEDPLKIFRDIRLKKFPYVVVYEMINDTVIVFAVFHLHRNPDNKISTVE